MKCLVLLLAVAVCQGAIIRERSFEKRRDVPDIYKQKLDQLKVSTIKKPVQLLQQPGKLLQTPWIQSTKPNILDYITRFNKQPWQQLDLLTNGVFDYKNYKNFRELMQFPGSEFLQEEIDKYTRNLPMDTELPVEEETVKDFYNIVPMIVEKLEETVPQYMEIIREPSTLAELITRDVIKMVLQKRMQCSTTTWDKQFIKRVQTYLVRTMQQTQYQLQENFQTLLPQVMPVEREMIDRLVKEFTWDVEQTLFKDVSQYVHGVAFKDVAIVSHKLYHELKQLFKQTWTRDPQMFMQQQFKQTWTRDPQMFMQQLITVVTNVVSESMTCPRQQQFDTKMELACWDFQNLFLEREVAHLHSRVQNLIHKIQNGPCSGEECMQYNWNFPQTYQRNFRQTYQRNFPQTYQRNFPQTYQRNFPQTYQRNFRQTYQRNFRQTYQRNFRQTYQRNFRQTYQRNFPQTFQRNFRQTYKPTYPQIYKPNYPRIFPEDNAQSYQQMYPEFYPRMNDVCKKTIELYVETIIQNVPICQSLLCTDPTKCFQNYQMLEPKEIEYMQTLQTPVWNLLSTKIHKDRQL